MSDPNANNIVFNLNKSNTTAISSSTRYFQIRDLNLIDKVEDYYVRVLEAKVPITEIPFFIMKPNLYSVTIGNIQVYLIPPAGVIPKFDGYIYYYQQFLDSLNAALRTAHNANGYTTASPPYAYYDENVEYMKLVFDYQYFTLNMGTRVNVFFNKVLLFKLPGFINSYDPFATLGRDYNLYYEVLANNYFTSGFSDSINYECVVMSSQNKFMSDLLEFQNIVITTQAIPIVEQPISSLDGVNRTLKILATIPLSFNNTTKTRYLTYEQTYPRWNDTNTQGALKVIDVEVYYVGDDFSIYPMTLLPGENLSIRVQFVKKNLVENYLS